MAERGNLNRVISARIIYETFRRSIWMNIANRGWEAEFRQAWKGIIPDIDITVTGTEHADTEALEQPLSFTTSDISEIEIIRKLYTATGQVNARQVVESKAGGQIESKLIRQIAIDIAQKVDAEVSSLVKASSYTGGPTNGYQINCLADDGTNGEGFTRAKVPVFRAIGTSTVTEDEALEQFVETLAAARLYAQDLNLIGQEVIGPDMPSNLVCVTTPQQAYLLGKHFRRLGQELMPGSAGRQALANAGILSNSAYSGRVAEIDIVSDQSLGVPSGNANYQSYIVPSRATVAAGMEIFRNNRYDPTLIDTGEYVIRRVSSVAYWAKILRKAHLGRITLNAIAAG